MTRSYFFFLLATLLAAGCGDGPKPSEPKPANATPDPRIERGEISKPQPQTQKRAPKQGN